MPYKCCVPACRGNYDEFNKVTCFGFPTDKTLQEKWLQAIPRKNFTVTKNSKVCERHFKESEVLRKTSFYVEETGVTLFASLKKPKLKENAVPSIFPECMSYLTAPSSLRRKCPSAKKQQLKYTQIKLVTSSTSVKQEIDPSLVEPIVKIKEEPVDDYPDPSTSVDNASEEFILPDKNNSWALTDSVVLPQVILSVASLASPNKPETSDAQQPKKKPRTNSSETEVTSPNDAEVRTQNPELNFECITNPSSSTTYCIDQFDAFGVYVATKLRSFDAVSSSFVQKAIRDLILEAEMGKYRNQSQGLKS